MKKTDKIKTAFARQTRAVELREGVGKGTAVTKVRVVDGVTCEVEEGPWKLVTDMTGRWGGNDKGPNSGILGRGALGSCLATSYVMWAARFDLEIQKVEVEVHADYDTRGICAVGDVSPGYLGVRCVVTIESPAGEEDLKRMMAKAERHCPYLQVFRNGVDTQIELRHVGPDDFARA